MSFDVYIDGDDIGNYTSNLGGYFRWAFSEDGEPKATDKGRVDSRDAIFGERPRDGLVVLDGMLARDAVPLLCRAITRTVMADPNVLDGFGPSNGWGDWQGALEYLLKILAACALKPGGILEVSL